MPHTGFVHMTRLLSILLLAAPLFAQEQGPPPRHVDRFGDPLPAGAVQRFGSLRLRHLDLADFVVLPDGKTVVSVGRDRTVRWWDLDTGKQTASRRLPEMGLWMGSLSADGSTVVGVDRDSVQVIDAKTGRVRDTFLKGEVIPVDGFAVSADGSRVAVVGGGVHLTLYDAKTRKAVRYTLGPEVSSDYHLDAAFSPDGKRLVVGGIRSGKLVVLDTETGAEVLNRDCFSTVCVFTPAGDRLAVVEYGKDWFDGPPVLRMLDVKTGKELFQVPAAKATAHPDLAVSPDGKWLVVGNLVAPAALLDAATGRVVRSLIPGTNPRFTPDGKRVVFMVKHRMVVCDVATGAAVGPGADEPNALFTQAAPAPDGRTLVVPSSTGLDLWDAKAGGVRRALPGPPRMWPGFPFFHAGFADGGRTVLAAGYYGDPWKWDAATGRLLAGRWPPDLKETRRVRFAPDGGGAAVVCWEVNGEHRERRLEQWDARGQVVRRVPLNAGENEKSLWRLAGDVLLRWEAEADSDNDPASYIVCDPWTAAPRYTLTADVKSASADGRWLVVHREDRGVTSGVRLIEAASGEDVTPPAFERRINYRDVRVHGRTAVAMQESNIAIFDLAIGQSLGALELAESARVTPKFILPDGKTLFTTLRDGTALTWNMGEYAVKPLSPTHAPADLATWWADLADANAKMAYAAIWKLAETPADDLIPFLKDRLRPVAAPPAAEWVKLIASLDHPEFRVRAAALRRIEQFGPGALDDIRRELSKATSSETRERLGQLAAKLDGPTPPAETLRFLRALVVLEEVKSPAARRLVEDLSRGMATARETKAAVATLGRMADGESWRK